MIRPLFVVMLVLAGIPTLGAEQLQVEVEIPSIVLTNQPFDIRIVATNVGDETLIFKRHWKWAQNTWFIQVEGSTGNLQESSPFLGSIPIDLICTYFVPLHPGDSLSTPATVNGTWPPSLDLQQPGEYRLRLVYVSESRPKEEHCATGGVPIWKGRTESPWVQFKVVQE